MRSAGRIIVLDGGHLAESGTFGEMVARGGIFAGPMPFLEAAGWRFGRGMGAVSGWQTA